MIRPRRTLTTIAVGFLALDAVLFAYAGSVTGRVRFILASVACALGAAFVVVAWRRYCRTLAELDQARREMRAEIESIRGLLHSHHLDN